MFVLYVVSLIVVIASTIYLVIDYYGPDEIVLHNDTAFGFSCLRANELVVQSYDADENLYAARGMIIYKLAPGQLSFKKLTHVPTGFSIFWFRNFSIVRRWTNRLECMEVVIKGSGEITALSAGKMWHLPKAGKAFKETLTLSHYGKGDQGIFEYGIMSPDDSTIYFGEYFRNVEKKQVRIFSSKDHGNSWRINYTFKPGEIRHIHALQNDPFSKKLWICTGDTDLESSIGWSEDQYETIVPIGGGNQLWKTTTLVFTPKHIYWGTDTSSDEFSGIYVWERDSQKIKKLIHVDGCVLHATSLKNGTIVMATNREGSKNEKDERTRIYIIKEGTINSFDCGTWEHNSPGFWFKYAKLRIQRNQGSPALAMTCLSQKELPNGELLIIPEQSLLDAIP